MSFELNNLIKRYLGLSEDNPINQVKIDHYSWSENSIYRYFEKDLINRQLIRQVEIAVENEFLRWDDEYSKQVMIEGLSVMRCDNNIPNHNAWDDDFAFEKEAISSLKSIIINNIDSNITEIVRIVECRLQEAQNQNDIRLIQIYERILYELNECSLREFYELKRAVLCGE